MIYVAKITVLISAMVAIAACGGSDSEGGGGQANASVSPASTLVSNDGQVVAGAVFGGGIRSSNATPIKSTKFVSPEVSAQSIAVDLLVAKIVQDSLYGIRESSQAKTITTSTNAQNTTGSIKFVDERVSVGNGYITFNGEFSAEKTDDLHVVGSGTLSAKQENVDASVLRDGSTYSEVVNGTVTFEMSMALTYTQNASGQKNGYKTSGDVTLKGSNITVSGDVSGSVSSMNAKYHYESVDDVKGTAIVSESCDGYLSVDVNGEQAVCDILAGCDGCKQP